MTFNPSVPVGIPTPDGARGLRLLNAIWRSFKANNEWPTFDEIDRQLYKTEGTADALEEAIREIPQGLVRGIDLRRPQWANPTDRIQVTLAGAANCQDSASEINALMGLVRLSASIERDWEPPKTQDLPSQPVLSLEVIKAHAFDPNALPANEVLYRAAQLSFGEPWFAGSGSRPDDLFWQLGFDRRIRPFADVRNFTEYWQARMRVLAPEVPVHGRTSARLPASGVQMTGDVSHAVDHAAAVVQDAPAPALAGLHTRVMEAAGRLFRDGYVKHAVFETCLQLEHRVQTLTGVADNGQSLMATAFNDKQPILDPATGTDPQTRGSELAGFRFLFMGVMSAIRNPHGHGSYPPYSEEEALEVLSLLSFLFRRLDLAEEQLQNASQPDRDDSAQGGTSER